MLKLMMLVLSAALLVACPAPVSPPIPVEVMVAVGANGSIARSLDAGRTRETTLAKTTLQQIPGNLTVLGDLRVNGEINEGRFAQLDALASSMSQLQTQGFLSDLHVRGQLYDNFGTQWIGPIVNPFAGAQLLCVCFGNNVFLAGATTNKIGRSTDNGATWTLIANPFVSAISAIAFGNNTFIAIGDNKSISTSTDFGLTWSALIANPFAAGVAVRSVAFGNGIFVIVGDNGQIARSTDNGATWGALIGNPFGGAVTIRSVAFGAGVFVAAGDSSEIARSTDLGLTWGSLIANPFAGGSSVRTLAFGNNVFVAAGLNNQVARSVDLGLTWGGLISAPFVASNCISCSYNYGCFQIGSDAGTTARSTDNGLTWGSLITNPFGANQINGIASGPTSQVGVGANGSIATAGWSHAATWGKEQPYTPTFTGFGVVTAINFTWSQVGNKMKVIGIFTAGTHTGVNKISLPNSLVVDSLVPNTQMCGMIINNSTNPYVAACLMTGGSNLIQFGILNGSVNNFTPQNLSAWYGNSFTYSPQFEVPISGWNV
jgi:photosystem II stability/assembly factor-like uncharacterized protein